MFISSTLFRTAVPHSLSGLTITGGHIKQDLGYTPKPILVYISLILPIVFGPIYYGPPVRVKGTAIFALKGPRAPSGVPRERPKQWLGNVGVCYQPSTSSVEPASTVILCRRCSQSPVSGGKPFVIQSSLPPKRDCGLGRVEGGIRLSPAPLSDSLQRSLRLGHQPASWPSPNQ